MRKRRASAVRLARRFTSRALGICIRGTCTAAWPLAWALASALAIGPATTIRRLITLRRRCITRRRRHHRPPYLLRPIGTTARRPAPITPIRRAVQALGSSWRRLHLPTDMATKPEPANDIKVDPNSLYLEEVFTDRRVGTIRRMTPVNKEGARDQARAVLYIGETQVLTPAGALPIG